MIGLWIIAGLLSAGTLALLLPPLMRRAHTAPSRGDYDIGIYRDQLEEVTRDLDRGLLNDEQADAARTEIQRRMLAAADDESGEKGAAEDAGEDGDALPPSGLAAKTSAALVAVLVPVGAVSLYLTLGAPATPDYPVAERSDRHRAADVNRPAGAEAGAGSTSLEQMVGRLAERLLQAPDDLDGWLLLARSYVNLQRFDAAANTYRRALELSGGNPDIAADYAEVLVTAADGAVTGEALRLFRGTFDANPRNPKARFYLGSAKAQQGDLKGAAQAWIDLIAVSPADAPWLAMVRQRVAKAAGNAGLDLAALRPSPEAAALAAQNPPQNPSQKPPMASSSPTPAGAPTGTARTAPAGEAPGPSRADVEAAGAMSTEERGAMIRSMVARLAARLEENPNDRQGWLRLGRAYQVLGEAENSKHALARADALKK